MATLSIDAMRAFLSQSISSLNQNKLNGLLAEVELRNYLGSLGFGDRVSPGGWILRNVGEDKFGSETVVVFSETVKPAADYSPGRTPDPPPALHSIAAVFRHTGIRPYYCAAEVAADNTAASLSWKAMELALPTGQTYRPFPSSITGFLSRERKYNFLRYRTITNAIPDAAVPEEFSKEHLRVAFANSYMAEISDVDGVLFGNQMTYPVEIKEKTAAYNKKLGPYFGLDLGPFVKLAFYAAKRGNLHSLFIVREINNVQERAVVGWWVITFEQLAQFASWVQQGGGTSMTGSNSAVVTIPRSAFSRLDAASLSLL